MTETFTVWYISNKTFGFIWECECQHVDLETATKWFKHHTTNVAAKMGITERVIITDSGDCIVAEWKHGEGLVWPKEKSDE